MNDKPMTVRVDRYTRFCLTAIAVLLTLTVVGLWNDAGPRPPSAQAAEPFGDAGGQRDAMLRSQDKTNSKLDELITLLRNGEAKVQVVEGGKKEDIRGATSRTQ
jgi:low affinity Fe/Cu permease